MNSVDVGYAPGKPILKKMTLRIDADDRIALLGANGNGKSTFAKLLAGRLKPETGTMTVAPGLKVAIFAQHQLDDLRPEENAYEHVRRLMPDAPESKVRARVAQFGLTTEKMNTPAKDLSGGEKARLLMGLAAFDGPNLFILDEPTNHLDIDSRESLIHALNEFPGAVILISHDRHLLEATADRLWLVKDGAVNPYDGDLDDYKTLVTGVSGDRRERREAEKASKADRRREAAARRAAAEPLAKEIRATEALMDRLRKRIDTIEDQLADPKLYEKDPTDGDAARQGALGAFSAARPPRGEVAGDVGGIRGGNGGLGAIPGKVGTGFPSGIATKQGVRSVHRFHRLTFGEETAMTEDFSVEDMVAGEYATDTDAAWRRDVREGVRQVRDLDGLPLSPDERAAARAAAARHKVRIPKSYLDLIDWNDPADPIRLQVIPSSRELAEEEGELGDPIADHDFSPVPG